MPELLDYASPQTESRPQPVSDRLVIIFASLQIVGWGLAIADMGDPVMGTEHNSLFAWAWQCTQSYTLVGAIITVSSLFVLIAATLPVDKRFGKYRAYLIAISIVIVLYWAMLWYLAAQMPGAFATMLRESNPHVAALMLILKQPVYCLFLVRLILPRTRLEWR